MTSSSVEIGPSGLVVDGEEKVLLCASLFSFRLPREEWAARLAQVRATGYDAVDVYVPWNFHELEPGRWDFTGRRDVGTFLDLAHEAGLLVVARPGPYICSEWDGGALPAWLTLEPGLRLRQAEPRYLEHVREWFEQVLPVLAARQHGRGGSVVAVQLENELDFFDCDDRAGYVGALADLARGHGITVPLVACAGQGDLVGATGGVDGVVPAFNFYPDDRSPHVEAEVRRYAELVAGRGEPLLVTETNRRHVTLRRLLVSGATLLAPYLQASGFDLGYTPSVGNWGEPGSFMTHDYDFGGFLSPTGVARPEVAQGRVLAAVARTLGPALARAVPRPASHAYATDAPTSVSPSLLELHGGGTLLGVPNLGESWATATVPVGGGRADVEVPLPPESCLLVLRDLPLDALGAAGTLRLSTADLVGAGPDGLELASCGAAVVVLEAPHGETTVVELAAPGPGAPVRQVARAGDERWDLVLRHPEDVPGPVGADVALVGNDTADADPFEDTTVPASEVVGAVRLAAPTRRGGGERYDLPPASEEVGVHRGRTHYAADVAGAAELVIEGAGDMVDLALDGVALPTLARFGAAVVVPTGGAGHLEATVETWGHANFDDARLPGLRAGSLRGLGRVWSVVARDDVSALWSVTAGEQQAGDPAPLRTLGGWSSTRVGRPVTYRRPLPVDGAHHHVLRLDGVPGSVDVLVDGARRTVVAEDPWLHLAPGEGAHVEVTLPHAPGALGGAELLRLAPVRGWQVEPQPDTAILDLAARPAEGVEVGLPLDLEPGDEAWLDVPLPAGGRSLWFAGTQVRVSAFAHGELLGRVWLGDPAAPRFSGGRPTRLWLPAAWNDGGLRLLVRATAGPDRPRLARLRTVATQE
ncbi:beta-galactosidase [Krasilnikoviella flava]|uniref:beta-galactosidase n=1 Tax=Krasilnikoviella flava TaxID=526729 RepID=UPI001C37A643|nr:beta-galactosidase [Krasilnikoviella flava]